MIGYGIAAAVLSCVAGLNWWSRRRRAGMIQAERVIEDHRTQPRKAGYGEAPRTRIRAKH